MDVATSAHAEVRRSIVRVSIVGLILGVALVWLASLRFPVTLVLPPQPTPDYTIQTVWSLVGVGLVAAIAISTAITAWRLPERSRRVATIGVLAMIVCGISCAFIAIVASTP